MNGDILKKLRKERKLTQAELAKKLQVTQSSIATIENGKREGNRDIEVKAANFFGVSLDYLQGLTDERDLKSEQKDSLINDFLQKLVDQGIIKDVNDIDEDTENMILNFVKAEIALLLKSKNK